MKTTLEIPDPICRRAKSKAAERGIPLRQFVTEAVGDKLKTSPAPSKKPWIKHMGKLKHLHSRAERVAIPVIVLGEYRLGIAQSRQRDAYERWLQEWTAAVEVLDIEEDTTQHYALIGMDLKRIGRPIPTNDLWIAALCRQHALSLLSRDRRFDAIPGIERVHW